CPRCARGKGAQSVDRSAVISGKGGREVGGDAKEPGLCWSQCGTAQEAAFRDTRIPVHAIAAAAGRQGRAHQGMVQDRILEPTRQAQTQDHEDFERVIGDATVEVKIWPFFVTHRLMGMARQLLRRRGWETQSNSVSY